MIKAVIFNPDSGRKTLLAVEDCSFFMMPNAQKFTFKLKKRGNSLNLGN